MAWVITANQSFRGKRVLVTGAGGFIGSHLAEHLVRAGADVTALVRYNAVSSIGNLAGAPREVAAQLRVVPGQIEDAEHTARIAEGMDVVFHLAALISIPFSYEAPRAFMNTNVGGTLNVLEAARRQAIGRVVLTSTSEVYGTAQCEPIDESHPIRAQSPYAASKVGADALGESYARAFDLDIVTVRPFNVFGPRQSARAFIPTVIAQALWADVIALGSLEPRRDMTYVVDTVRAFVAAALTPAARGHVINVGTGEARSVGGLARVILALLGVDKPIVVDPRRVRPAESEVFNLRSDSRFARDMFGWSALTSLESGLRQTIAFIGDHPDRHAALGYVK